MPKIAIVIFLLKLESGLFINTDTSSITNNIYSFASLIKGEDNIITQGENVLRNLFLFSSLLSLIIGTVVGLAQYKIKRLLAYSTISHVGFLLLALAVNTEQSTESLIFYILQYSLTNLNTFLIILVFGYSLNTYWKNQSINVIHFPTSITDTKNNSNILNTEVENFNNKSNKTISVTNIHSMTISVLTMTIMLFILNPSIILNSTHLLALSIFTCWT